MVIINKWTLQKEFNIIRESVIFPQSSVEQRQLTKLLFPQIIFSIRYCDSLQDDLIYLSYKSLHAHMI